jgi:hypothetical protein
MPLVDGSSIRWDDDPDNYDLRLHALNPGHAEFIVVNPMYDAWILDHIDTSLSDTRCIMWVKGDRWLAKKFHKNWEPADGWVVIEVDLTHAGLPGTFTWNPDLPAVFDRPEYIIELVDANLDHVWYLSPDYFEGSKIWVCKQTATDRPRGVKDMGYIEAGISTDLDVVFISYDEPNADYNYALVKAVAPDAKRVHGVKGIFEAHRAAAALATTDMFWVVDGDAELAHDWKFTYNPSIFNRDVVHVWPSINPVNGLSYGYGGVKLFPRQQLLALDTWRTDMTTSLGKLKVMGTISCTTAYNTDDYAMWRAAFRECAKLAGGTIKNQIEDETRARLGVWLTVGPEASLKGARAGFEYGQANKGNPQALSLVNDRDWLHAQYQ